MAVKHRHVRDLFEKALLGAMNDAERARFASHVRGCDVCARELADAEKAKGWAGLLAEGGPREEEMKRVSDHLERAFGWRRSRSRMIGYPAVAAAAIVALLIVARRAREPGAGFVPAALTAPAGPAKVKEYVGAATAMPLIRFRNPADLSGMAVSGFCQPELVGDRFTGRKVMRLGARSAPEAECELGIPAPVTVRGSVPDSVSLRAFSEDGTAVLKVTAVLDSGRQVPAEEPRRIEPGEWKLAVFELEAGRARAGEGLKEVRICVMSTGPVRLDRIEAWCRGGAR